MKTIIHILLALVSTHIFSACNAQIKNQKIETVHIFGNCGMCEKTIEKAGYIKKVAKVDWSQDSKMATLTYDSVKTNQDEILKRIALSGYDSDKFLAPDDVYAELPACCQYERPKKETAKADIQDKKTESSTSAVVHNEHQLDHEHQVENKDKEEPELVQKTTSIQTVFESYFALKNVLVKSDAKSASNQAIQLMKSMEAVNMKSLKEGEHTVWMQVLENLKKDAAAISSLDDVAIQRKSFSSLSQNMYKLLKATQPEQPVYLQHCPMYDDGKGADWLSQENVVKNPYYGAEMLSCGKVTEIIK